MLLSRRCLSCGASVRQAARFCPQCGIEVKDAASSSSDTQESDSKIADSTNTSDVWRVHKRIKNEPPLKNETLQILRQTARDKAENTSNSTSSNSSNNVPQAASEQTEIKESVEVEENVESGLTQAKLSSFNSSSAAAAAARSSGVAARRNGREHWRESSAQIFDQAAIDPSVRFVLVALVLLIISFVIIFMSRVIR